MKRSLDSIIQDSVRQNESRARHVDMKRRSKKGRVVRKPPKAIHAKRKRDPPCLTSYDPNLNTPDRFQPVVRNRVYSSGSKRLVDLTAVNIMKAHGIEHIVFISSKDFPLPSYWEETGISFQRFPVEASTNLPTPSQVKEIMAQIEMLLEENPDDAVLLCNYSNSDSQYAVHIIASLVAENHMKKSWKRLKGTLGTPTSPSSQAYMREKQRLYKENYGRAIDRMFQMASYNRDDMEKREMFSERLADCFDAIFPTQSKIHQFFSSGTPMAK